MAKCHWLSCQPRREAVAACSSSSTNRSVQSRGREMERHKEPRNMGPVVCASTYSVSARKPQLVPEICRSNFEDTKRGAWNRANEVLKPRLEFNLGDKIWASW
jgi:hypothetical protein